MSVSIISAQALRDSGALAVDARTQDRYRAAHIPGAVWMDWRRWIDPAPEHAPEILKQPGYWGIQSTGAELSRRLTAAGLRDDEPVVVYGNGSASKGSEGRIAWMLLFLGARAVALLDGGWAAWLASGGAAVPGRDAPRRGRFTVQRDERRRCTLDTLRSHLERGRLPLMIDTRSPREYTGEEGAYLPKQGHVPHSVFIDYARLFRPDGRFISREAYLAQIPGEIVSAPDRVAYCEVGVRASLFALLHEAYTGEMIPVYDGSLIEWGLHGLPVERHQG